MKTSHRAALPVAFSLVGLLVVLALCNRGAGSNPAASPGEAPALPPLSNGAISPQNQADALHFVIAADRELYCREFSAHQGADALSANAAADARRGDVWTSPCEMFRRASEAIQNNGAEFSYSLRSVHALDPRNEPQTELEQRGLAFVADHPAQNYYGQEILGGRRYFTAVYPDLPAVASCVDCHSRRSTSVPNRYRVGDPMGGIVVRVPLEF